MRHGSMAERASTPRGRPLSISCVALAWAAATPVAAQLPELPTLSGAGLEYLSGSGAVQLSLSGQLDLEALHVEDAWAGLVTRTADELPVPDNRTDCVGCHRTIVPPSPGGALGAHRLRVLADLFLGDHVYSSVEVRSDRGHAPSDGAAEVRIEQAFLRLTTGAGGLGVQGGRFASPFGSYAARHLAPDRDPFVRPPLGYDYRTAMSRELIPADADLFLNWKEVPTLFRRTGAPPIWDVPYQWGAMAFGRLGPLDLSVAAMNGAPSSAPDAWAFDWRRFRRPSWVIGVRTALSAALEIGASYDRGPWLERPIAGSVHGAGTAGTPASHRDFDQELVSVDAAYARGPVVVRAEVIVDRWQMPNVADDPRERIYDVEAQWDLAAGLFLAARWGMIDFRPLSDGLGPESPRPGGRTDWDHDVARYEGSVGYRLARNLGVLVSAYRQLQAEATDGDTTFLGARLWWAF